MKPEFLQLVCILAVAGFGIAGMVTHQPTITTLCVGGILTYLQPTVKPSGGSTVTTTATPGGTVTATGREPNP